MMALIRLKVIWIAGLVCTFLVLGGCVSTDSSDLHDYIAEILLRPGGRIEPLPEIKPYEAYAYQSAGQDARDPFKLFYQADTETLTEEQEDAGLTKEMEDELRHRNKEELEQYELDSLRMVGTMDNGDTNWGIIQDPGGAVHRIRVGNYMGRNIGKVLNVYEDRIEIREIFRNSQGRWEERQAAIALVEVE
jgi:type IV pilus assembly protein PilP